MNYELEVYKALLDPMLMMSFLIGIEVTVLIYEVIDYWKSKGGENHECNGDIGDD